MQIIFKARGEKEMKLEEIKRMGEAYLMQTYARADFAFERGEGARLYDVEGRDYIDFGSGIGVNSIGYGNTDFVQALSKQAQNLIHSSNLYHISKQALLAKKLVELSAYDMNVFFANSGAEANEGMIKLARKYGEIKFSKKRYKIITLHSSFHGRTLATLKATGQESFHRFFSPFPEGFVIASDLEDVYQKIDEETCAVMLELIRGEGGVYALDRTEVKRLEKYLQEKQILLMVDEVQSGVYRSGEFLASQLYGISPDVISLGKGLGGGVPIAAVMSKHKEVFQAGDHGSTFGGNFLSTSAGLKVLEILEKEKKSGALDERIRLFDLKLEELLGDCESFVKKVGVGLMLGLQAKDLETQQRFINQALQNGVIVLRAGKNVVRFLPPLTISNDEIEEGFERLRKMCFC